MRKPNITEKHFAQLYQLYLELGSIRKVAKIYHTSEMLISKIFKANGIKPKTKSESR